MYFPIDHKEIKQIKKLLSSFVDKKNPIDEFKYIHYENNKYFASNVNNLFILYKEEKTNSFSISLDKKNCRQLIDNVCIIDKVKSNYINKFLSYSFNFKEYKDADNKFSSILELVLNSQILLKEKLYITNLEPICSVGSSFNIKDSVLKLEPTKEILLVSGEIELLRNSWFRFDLYKKLLKEY